MIREIIIEKVKDILDITNIEETDKISSFIEDSLSVFESIMYVEDAFDVNIPIDHTIVTFGDLITAVEKALNGKKTSII